MCDFCNGIKPLIPTPQSRDKTNRPVINHEGEGVVCLSDDIAEEQIFFDFAFCPICGCVLNRKILSE